jgi:hypothetical protein
VEKWQTAGASFSRRPRRNVLSEWLVVTGHTPAQALFLLVRYCYLDYLFPHWVAEVSRRRNACQELFREIGIFCDQFKMNSSGNAFGRAGVVVLNSKADRSAGKLQCATFRSTCEAADSYLGSTDVGKARCTATRMAEVGPSRKKLASAVRVRKS